MIPELEPHCGSWVVVDRETGESVLETFSKRLAESINQNRYEVVTALQWLHRFNGRARDDKPNSQDSRQIRHAASR
jgi:hypothetical protein